MLKVMRLYVIFVMCISLVPLSSGCFNDRLSGNVTVVSALLAAIVSTGAEDGLGTLVPVEGLLIYAVVSGLGRALLLASSN